MPADRLLTTPCVQLTGVGLTRFCFTRLATAPDRVAHHAQRCPCSGQWSANQSRRQPPDAHTLRKSQYSRQNTSASSIVSSFAGQQRPNTPRLVIVISHRFSHSHQAIPSPFAGRLPKHTCFSTNAAHQSLCLYIRREIRSSERAFPDELRLRLGGAGLENLQTVVHRLCVTMCL